MENKRKLSVDYLNIVFKFETDVFKEGDTIRYRFAEFLGLDLDDLDGAGGVYGYEASRRGNGVLVAWREVKLCSIRSQVLRVLISDLARKKTLSAF